ncbi:hypothetical protein MASR2M12_12680 [Bacteroidales bacterium]
MKQYRDVKKLLCTIILLVSVQSGFAQTFLNEKFNGAFPPQGWTIDNVAEKWVKSETNNAGGEAP